jgi:hypothetical protein
MYKLAAFVINKFTAVMYGSMGQKPILRVGQHEVLYGECIGLVYEILDFST